MHQEEVGMLNVRGVASDAFLKMEQRGMEPVPETERHGAGRELAPVWTGAMANDASLLRGAVLHAQSAPSRSLERDYRRHAAPSRDTIPFLGSATPPWLSQPWQGPMAHLLGGMDISGIARAVVSAFLYSLLARPYFSQLARKPHSNEEEAHEPSRA